MANRERSGIAVGTTATAGLLLVLVGFFHIAQGIVDLTNNDFYAVGENWAFRFNVTTWGWLHLLGGIVVLLAVRRPSAGWTSTPCPISSRSRPG